MTPASSRRLWLVTAALLFTLLAWDATDLDMTLAGWSGSPAGFALRDYWLTKNLLHEGGRAAAWVLVLCLGVGVWWPRCGLERISRVRRLQLVVSTLLGTLSVSVVKSLSPTSCPWDLAAFGQTARHLSHWAMTSDGGSGRCFPAGHASAGFAFVSGYFAFRHAAPGVARGWLTASVVVGFVFGIAQQVRGAHFMSHTLWTGLICWTVALALDPAWSAVEARARAGRQGG